MYIAAGGLCGAVWPMVSQFMLIDAGQGATGNCQLSVFPKFTFQRVGMSSTGHVRVGF